MASTAALVARCEAARECERPVADGPFAARTVRSVAGSEADAGAGAGLHLDLGVGGAAGGAVPDDVEVAGVGLEGDVVAVVDRGVGRGLQPQTGVPAVLRADGRAAREQVAVKAL